MKKNISEKPIKQHSETALSHMVKHVSTASLHETVGDILKRLQNSKATFDTVDYTFVLHHDQRIAGVVSIKELLHANDSVRVADIMHTKVRTVHPSTDQERVAFVALRENIKVVPVVDKNHKFLGVVPSDTILNILEWEHTEDLLRFSGVRGKGEKLRNFVKSGVFSMSKARLPSILIGVMGGLFATSVVEYFEKSLEEELVLAFFIPVMLYICAAVGTQTGTILVRTLATEEVKIHKYVIRELLIGSIIAALVGGFMFSVVFFWFKSHLVALTIGISLLIGVMTATLIGVFVPLALFKLKKDPAVSGGPFINILQDILTLVIYFSVASVILL